MVQTKVSINEVTLYYLTRVDLSGCGLVITTKTEKARNFERWLILEFEIPKEVDEGQNLIIEVHDEGGFQPNMVSLLYFVYDSQVPNLSQNLNVEYKVVLNRQHQVHELVQDQFECFEQRVLL